MDNLTIALACVGGVVLAGVVAHGAWQARKAGPLRPSLPVAPPAEPREPVLDGGPHGAAGDDTPTLPEDPAALRALLLSAWAERDALATRCDGVAAERDALAAQNERLQHLFPGCHRFELSAQGGWVRALVELPARVEQPSAA